MPTTKMLKAEFDKERIGKNEIRREEILELNPDKREEILDKLAILRKAKDHLIEVIKQHNLLSSNKTDDKLENNTA